MARQAGLDPLLERHGVKPCPAATRGRSSRTSGQRVIPCALASSSNASREAV